MDPNIHLRQIKITNLLPFMNKKFFEIFLEKNKIRVIDIKVECQDSIPSKNKYNFRLYDTFFCQ